MSGETAAGVIAVGNLKGGVGKSTLAVNLACALAAGGGDSRAAAIVDTDPQETAARWAMWGRTPAPCYSLPVEDFDGAGEWLGDLGALRERHGVLVVDLPAVLSPALASAFMVADLVLIPTSDSQVDLLATARTLHYVRLARQERPACPPRVLVVPNNLQPRPRAWRDRGCGDAAPALLELKEPVGPPLHRWPEHAAAFAAGEWIGDHAPRSTAHKEVLAVEAAARGLLGAPAAAAAADAPAPHARDGALAVRRVAEEGSRISRLWRRCAASL